MHLQILNIGHNTVIFIVFRDAYSHVQLLKMFVCEQDNIHRSQSTNATTHHAEVNITMEFPFKICKVERASMEVSTSLHT